MKNVYPVLLAFVLFALLLPTSALAQRDYDVDEFNEIAIGISGDIYIEPGEEHTVSIDADDKILDEIEVSVRGGRLVIDQRSRWGFNRMRSWKKIIVRITTPELRELNIGGSANAEVGRFNSDRMYLSVSGSGDIVMEGFEAKDASLRISGSGSILVEEGKMTEVEASVSGSGNIEMVGTAEEVVIRISGSGGVDFGKLVAKYVNVGISGSGDVRVHADESLEGHISGSGDIRYSGRPIVDVSTPGSGDIRHTNR